ncbi:MAG: AarF/ABC1/UbiB kinase family protein [Calditrichae bacterium]|nr:AarF/ABC1/UbiB kinase family protein [Calditrichia bacterium]
MSVTYNPLTIYKGALIRLYLLYKHTAGLLIGGLVAYVRGLPPYRKRWFRSAVPRISAFFLKIFVKRELRKEPFEVQLRRRLELLGPTYVKLGQIMAIREDIFPEHITRELKQLLDRLPEVPFAVIGEIIERSLKRPLKELFLDIRREPLGSASIGQTHRATTYHGKPVVIKVIKPGIRDTIMADIKLLQVLGRILEWLLPRYQPQVVINEFCRYTLKEVDLTFEADHAEIFAANFQSYPDVAFPRIYRELSSEDVLTMEFFDGFKPNTPEIFQLSDSDQQKVIETGVGTIIKMLYEDGFFHADLHAGNLIILPGPRIGFIDVGMVGRFDETIRRHMFYYFYSLVNGDIENTAKHLLAMAKVGVGGDIPGFKRAVTDLFRRYLLVSAHGNFSLAQLILASVSIGGRYRIFFPVEMTLMVKALVTFEGVGQYLAPHLDIPTLSRKHIQAVYLRRYNPRHLFGELMRNIPELIDTLVNLPQLASDGSRSLEQFLAQGTPENPLTGIKSSLMSGAMVIAGVLAFVQGAHPLLWIGLFVSSVLFFLYGK